MFIKRAALEKPGTIAGFFFCREQVAMTGVEAGVCCVGHGHGQLPGLSAFPLGAGAIFPFVLFRS